MRFFLPPQDSQDIDVNLTPLIDVVFVVLIMFIVIAPLLSTESLDLASSGPYSQHLENTSQTHPLFTLKKNDQIFWKNQAVSLEVLEKYLYVEKQKNPQSTPILIPDKTASFGSFQKVKNAIETAGFEKVHVVLKPSFT